MAEGNVHLFYDVGAAFVVVGEESWLYENFRGVYALEFREVLDVSRAQYAAYAVVGEFYLPPRPIAEDHVQDSLPDVALHLHALHAVVPRNLQGVFEAGAEVVFLLQFHEDFGVVEGDAVDDLADHGIQS